MPRFTRILLAAPAFCLLLGACSDSSGPSGPNVAGLWTGTFFSGSVSLQLGQSGTQVTGTLTSGSEVLGVTGDVASDGMVVWGSAVHTGNCAAYGSSGMQLRAAGDSLVGVAQRRSGAKVCDPEASGLVLVQQGEMRLSRVAP